MRKTLYARIVFVFITITLISLMASSLIGIFLFQQKINRDGQKSMLDKGHEIVQLYEKNTDENLEEFFQRMAKLTSYPIHFYDNQKQETFYSLNNNNVAKISDKSVETVLKGEVSRSTKQEKDSYVGLPITVKGQNSAIFLQFSYENELIFNMLLLFIIVCTLVLGSAGILIAAHYLISPLKKLKEATEVITTGDFDVALDLKRQDEVGELARSFNKMTDELKKMEEMRQDFVSNVSHEIQSPLTSISGFAKALKNEQLITDEQRPYYLNIIISESERLSRLGDNLLKLASLDSEHHPFKVESFDVVEQIRQTVVMLENQWSQKEIDVVILKNKPIFIKGDFDLLQQVWFNLLTNSIKFTPQFGKVMIDFDKQDQLIITFSDTGIGIPEEELLLIFQKFYKTDKSRTTKESGNGLGLAIVKKIIELHHGTIVVKNHGESGAEFEINIPYEN